MDKQKPSWIKKIFTKKVILTLIVVAVLAIIILPKTLFKPKVVVESTKIEKGKVESELIISGSVVADEYAQLSFSSSGELSFLGVHEGDIVKKGQLLARLDIANLNSTYESALADYRYYQANLDNVYDQVQGHADDESYSQRATRTYAESLKDKAYRALSIAKKNLANGGIVAPFDGVVTRIDTNTGVNTVASSPQIEIVNPGSLYFVLNADQNDVTSVSLEQKVNIVLDSFPDDVYNGSVNFISFTPESNQAGTVYRVKVVFSGPLDIGRIRMGMTGDAKLILDEKDNVLYLPPSYVKTDSKGTYVKKSSPSNKTYVKTGLESEERVEIEGDINEGDIVYN